MAEANEAPAPAPAAESENKSNTNQEQAAPAPEKTTTETPDMHGFTSEQLAEMKKFYDANGGFEKVKSRIANPEKAEQPKEVEQKQTQPEQTEQSQPIQPQPQQVPEGAVPPDAVVAEMYFKSLAQRSEYAPIAKEIENGSLLKEMSALGISVRNPDGSFNDGRINKYLELKAKTVPPKPTNSEPNASPAPTVEYVQVGEEIKTPDEAYAVLQQDAQLKSRGLPGHPAIAKAEEYLKGMLNPDSSKKKG